MEQKQAPSTRPPPTPGSGPALAADLAGFLAVAVPTVVLVISRRRTSTSIGDAVHSARRPATPVFPRFHHVGGQQPLPRTAEEPVARQAIMEALPSEAATS